MLFMSSMMISREDSVRKGEVLRENVCSFRVRKRDNRSDWADRPSASPICDKLASSVQHLRPLRGCILRELNASLMLPLANLDTILLLLTTEHRAAKDDQISLFAYLRSNRDRALTVAIHSQNTNSNPRALFEICLITRNMFAFAFSGL